MQTSNIQTPDTYSTPVKHKKHKKICIITISILSFIIIAICGTMIFLNNNTTYDKQIDLRYKYLNEGKYEEAILAFDKAIQIDTKNPDAYIGKAVSQSKIINSDTADNVSQTLITGYNNTASQKIITCYNNICADLEKDGYGNISSEIQNNTCEYFNDTPANTEAPESNTTSKETPDIPELSQEAMSKLYELAIPSGNGINEKTMSFNENTPTDQILYEYVLHQMGVLYTLFDESQVIENSNNDNDPKNIMRTSFDFSYYAYIDADIVDKALNEYFNFSQNDIEQLHEDDVYLSNFEEYDEDYSAKGYYLNGKYYFRMFDGLGSLPIEATRHNIIKKYPDNIYKFEIISEEPEYPEFDYKVYCIVQAQEDEDSFKILALSENPDIEYNEKKIIA